MTTEMTTEQATDVLAAAIGGPGGAACECVERAAAHGVTLTDDQVDAITTSLRAAHHHGCRTNWGDAEEALDRAYRALGATNPGTGYQWHCGSHPVQVRAEAMEREWAEAAERACRARRSVL